MYFIIFASLKVRIFRVRDYQAAKCKSVKLVYYCAASETESLFSLVYSETFNSNKNKLQLKNGKPKVSKDTNFRKTSRIKQPDSINFSK